MSRLQFFTLSLFLLLSGFRAQSPGYMGKRCSGGYGFYINPAITAAISDYGTSVINTQHELFFEVALKTRLSIGFSFRAYRSSYNNTSAISVNSKYKYKMDDSEYDLHPQGSIRIQAANYAIYAKVFKKGYVAPWGRYLLFGLSCNTRTSSYDPDEMKMNYSERGYDETTQSYTVTARVLNDFGDTKQFYAYPDLMFGAGNARVLWRHFVVDYGYSIHAMALTATIADAFDSNRPEIEKYIRNNSGMRVRGINRFNFFLKTAYLF